jgi:autotransporter-associated beta strand protein
MKPVTPTPSLLHSILPLRKSSWFLTLSAAVSLAGLVSGNAQSLRTWSETPTDGDWNDTANWAGGVIPITNDRIDLGSSTVTTLNNDIVGLTLSGSANTEYALHFTSTASAYTIGGNSITLRNSATSGNGPAMIFNESTATQTFNVNVTGVSAAGQPFAISTAGDLVFNGSLTAGNFTDLTIGVTGTISRTVTINGAVTLNASTARGISLGGNVSPGGVFTFNNTITATKTGANTHFFSANSGTTNLNASTSFTGGGAKTLNLMAGSSNTAAGSTLNINDAGALEEMTQINILQQGVGVTNGFTGTASLLVGASGWVSSGSINIGTNANNGASIVLGGKTGLGTSGTAIFNGNITALDSNLDRSRTVRLTAAEGRVNFNGVISTAAGGVSVMSIIKTGDGIVALAGASTYTGATTVSAGTLLLNNTAGSATGSTGVLTVNARLAGFGSTASATTIANGGRVTAGDFASGAVIPTIDLGTQGNNTLAFSQSLTIDGAYDWYLGAGSTAVGFTQLDISGGNLTLGGTSAFTLTSANFLNGFAPDQGDAFWLSNHTWVIADVAGASAITGSFGAVDLGTWSGGSFALSTTGGTGNDLTLTWVAVPEPGTAALAFAGLATVMLGARRRRSFSH